MWCFSLNDSVFFCYPEVQDLWDSIQNNEYFSSEGLWDVIKQVICSQPIIFFSHVNKYLETLVFWHFVQLRIYKTPDIETPNYLILKRTAHYEVLMHHQN